MQAEGGLEKANCAGLEDAFLRYIEATPDNQRRIQSFYIPFFTECQGLVVDLACGHGDFVHLLAERGVRALGVDSDVACCAEARQRGIDIVAGDVFDYLRQVEADSLAGIFSAHLVEHLHYQQVMELARLSYRALRPGGIIMLVTPNVRALYPHLESFYMHFGHVSFYHPKLLCFFLDYYGFSDPHVGENSRMSNPLWHGGVLPDPNDVAANSLPELEPDADALRSVPPVRYDPRLPSRYPRVFGRLVSRVKMSAVRLVVQPLLDRVVGAVNQSIHGLDENLRRLSDHVANQRRYSQQLNANFHAIDQRLTSLDRGVECYVYATKGEDDLDLPPELVGQRL